MEIIIIGAGLGGLCAALGLARKGHQVRVLEQRASLAPVGGALNIRPGASKILHEWGLGADLERVSVNTPANVLRDLATGEVATRSIATGISDFPDWGTTRAALIGMFYQRATEAGAEVLLNAAVTDVGEDDGQAFVTVGGTRFTADLVIAADGIRSAMRGRILGDTAQSFEPIVGDTTLYGVHLSKEDMAPHPELKPLIDQSFLNVFMGNDGILHVTSRFNSTLSSYAALFGVKGKTDQQGLWDETGDIEFVRGKFKDVCPEIREVLQLAGSCDRWRLAELPDLPRWTSEGGRIILLGDSAHGMQPSAAQGFSLTVEDIGVLVYLISTDPNPATAVPMITQDWQSIRKARCERIKAWARHNTSLFTTSSRIARPSKGPIQTQVRSLKDVKPDMHAKFGTSAFLKWAEGTDAIEER
ncbi:salicylate hydroxylase [Colletotrichum plurivorum]|uniref:Salicylate hydroxylase n=1 Tax=Colletotrichum plurivorum TaxID=2175906 RepID=A0A8H6KB19_9PEZI|nr:salicylate hydroxylase [Colletotrichum plurivorum]